jgi:cytochrome c
MKKYLIIAASAFLFACGNEGGDKTETKTEAKTDAQTSADAGTASQPTFPPGITQADYDKGLQLIAGSDCLTCHNINQKSPGGGPPYAEVAKKYEPTDDNIKMLAGKIIAGGQGVWGQIPMTAHDGLPEEDAKTMVKYIMTLKNVK